MSLLPAGVVTVQGAFDADDAVEIADTDGIVFAKGLVRALGRGGRGGGRTAQR